MNVEQILGAAGAIGSIALPGIGGPIAGVLGSLFGSSGDNKESLKNQKALMSFQSQLEQEKWLERFNLQNDYNLPAAARKRIEAAGLNPNLLYGSISGNLAASNPSSNTPSGQLSKYMATQEAIEKSSMLASQAVERERVKAETKLTNAQVKTEELRQDEIRSNTSESDARRGLYGSQAMTEDARRLEQTLRNNMLQKFVYEGGNFYKDEHDKVTSEIAFNDWKKTHDDKELKFQIERFGFEQAKWKQELELLWYKAKTERQMSDAQVKYYSAQTDYIISLDYKVQAETNGVILDNGIKSIKFTYSQYNEFMDIMNKIGRYELSVEQGKTEIAKRLHMDFQNTKILSDMLVSWSSESRQWYRTVAPHF